MINVFGATRLNTMYKLNWEHFTKFNQILPPLKKVQPHQSQLLNQVNKLSLLLNQLPQLVNPTNHWMLMESAPVMMPNAMDFLPPMLVLKNPQPVFVFVKTSNVVWSTNPSSVQKTLLKESVLNVMEIISMNVIDTKDVSETTVFVWTLCVKMI